METWKAIRGWEGLYEVSDQARIRPVGGQPFRPNHNIHHLGQRVFRRPEYLADQAFPERNQTPGEVWKDIPGLDYQASTLGRVRANGRPRSGTRPYRVVKARLHRSGQRLAVSLSASGKVQTHLVHRLVALAFHGSPRREDYDVHHINGNSLDNRPENLRWLSPKEHNRLHKTLRRLALDPQGRPW